ncbi:hypothetical protein ACROYT_G006357 [Oculina patagonica]
MQWKLLGNVGEGRGGGERKGEEEGEGGGEEEGEEEEHRVKLKSSLTSTVTSETGATVSSISSSECVPSYSSLQGASQLSVMLTGRCSAKLKVKPEVTYMNMILFQMLQWGKVPLDYVISSKMTTVLLQGMLKARDAYTCWHKEAFGEDEEMLPLPSGKIEAFCTDLACAGYSAHAITQDYLAGLCTWDMATTFIVNEAIRNGGNFPRESVATLCRLAGWSEDSNTWALYVKNVFEKHLDTSAYLQRGAFLLPPKEAFNKTDFQLKEEAKWRLLCQIDQSSGQIKVIEAYCKSFYGLEIERNITQYCFRRPFCFTPLEDGSPYCLAILGFLLVAIRGAFLLEPKEAHLRRDFRIKDEAKRWPLMCRIDQSSGEIKVYQHVPAQCQVQSPSLGYWNPQPCLNDMPSNVGGQTFSPLNKPFSQPLNVLDHLEKLQNAVGGHDLSLRRFSHISYSKKIPESVKCSFLQCDFISKSRPKMISHQTEVQHPGCKICLFYWAVETQMKTEHSKSISETMSILSNRKWFER